MIRIRRKLRWPLTIGAALALTSEAALAAPATATCSPTKMRVMVSVKTAVNTTNDYKTISEAVVSFTQGGSSASCVLVRFSAMATGNTLSVSDTATVRVRATIDDTVVATPAEVILRAAKSASNPFDSRSFEFLFPSVAPGPHVVRMQHLNGIGESGIAYHTTIVQHAP